MNLRWDKQTRNLKLSYHWFNPLIYFFSPFIKMGFGIFTFSLTKVGCSSAFNTILEPGLFVGSLKVCLDFWSCPVFPKQRDFRIMLYRKCSGWLRTISTGFAPVSTMPASWRGSGFTSAQRSSLPKLPHDRVRGNSIRRSRRLAFWWGRKIRRRFVKSIVVDGRGFAFDGFCHYLLFSDGWWAIFSCNQLTDEFVNDFQEYEDKFH